MINEKMAEQKRTSAVSVKYKDHIKILFSILIIKNWYCDLWLKINHLSTFLIYYLGQRQFRPCLVHARSKKHNKINRILCNSNLTFQYADSKFVTLNEMWLIDRQYKSWYSNINYINNLSRCHCS